MVGWTGELRDGWVGVGGVGIGFGSCVGLDDVEEDCCLLKG